jgi:4-amino-4-deoxy-L-arabinose transferase-like glycosyltransferase
LAFCIAIAMLSFWEALQEETLAFWKYLFFIATGFGMLAKGPIIILLTAPPISIWSMIHKISPARILKKLHWKSGILITLIIAVPWYILAEIKSPGFLDYFIIGEHFNRFFDSGWRGDLYGVPHTRPLGMIWLFLLIFAFPWVQLVFYKLWRERKSLLNNERVSFLTIWLLWIPFFFTFSSSIVHTYILPVMVPLALLVMHWWKDLKLKKTWLSLGAIFPVIVVVASIVFFSTERVHKYLNSDKYHLSSLVELPNTNQLPVVYWKRKSFSGQFYKKSKMALIKDDQALDSVLRFHDKLFIIIQNKVLKKFPSKYIENLELISGNYKTSLFLLNSESPLTKYTPTASNK